MATVTEASTWTITYTPHDPWAPCAWVVDEVFECLTGDAHAALTGKFTAWQLESGVSVWHLHHVVTGLVQELAAAGHTDLLDELTQQLETLGPHTGEGAGCNCDELHESRLLEEANVLLGDFRERFPCVAVNSTDASDAWLATPDLNFGSLRHRCRLWDTQRFHPETWELTYDGDRSVRARLGRYDLTVRAMTGEEIAVADRVEEVSDWRGEDIALRYPPPVVDWSVDLIDDRILDADDLGLWCQALSAWWPLSPAAREATVALMVHGWLGPYPDLFATATAAAL